mmetsp:Transcript_20042/g.41200  ORF Transcript_20042/g.41200 Transcript_20042/m.41200 type:complete len:282 (+) Transcript_20042:398-1243(+)
MPKQHPRRPPKRPKNYQTTTMITITTTTTTTKTKTKTTTRTMRARKTLSLRLRRMMPKNPGTIKNLLSTKKRKNLQQPNNTTRAMAVMCPWIQKKMTKMKKTGETSMMMQLLVLAMAMAMAMVVPVRLSPTAIPTTTTTVRWRFPTAPFVSRNWRTATPWATWGAGTSSTPSASRPGSGNATPARSAAFPWRTAAGSPARSCSRRRHHRGPPCRKQRQRQQQRRQQRRQQRQQQRQHRCDHENGSTAPPAIATGVAMVRTTATTTAIATPTTTARHRWEWA